MTDITPVDPVEPLNTFNPTGGREGGSEIGPTRSEIPLMLQNFVAEEIQKQKEQQKGNHTRVGEGIVVKTTSPEVLGALPLRSYDPLCFIATDPRLLHLMDGMSPYNSRYRSMAMMWLHHASAFGSCHWTTFVEFRYVEYEVDSVSEFVQDEPVYVEECDELVSKVISVFDVVEVESIDDPTLMQFDRTDVIKTFPVDAHYPEDAVADFFVKQGVNVVRLAPSCFGIYPTKGLIPNDFEAIRDECIDGFLPEGIQSHLMEYCIRKGLDLSKDLFDVSSVFVEQSETPNPNPVLTKPVNFRAALERSLVPLPGSAVRSPRSSSTLAPKAKAPLEGFAAFRADTSKITAPFGDDEFEPEFDDINQFFEHDRAALEVNKSMGGQTIQNMNARIKRYLKKVGYFVLTGKQRYKFLYLLLDVSGAFNLLRRKLTMERSYLLAMKVWLYRTSLIPDLAAAKIEFIAI
jgi:hypothetical protein